MREGQITPPELSSGTFSVSNLGMFGIRRFTAVINPPQAAILAVGEMKPTPVVRDGEVCVRAIMELTITCDHRILYGADAAQFLGRIRERLENPLSLVLYSFGCIESSRVTRAGRVSVSTIRHSQRRGSGPGTQARYTSRASSRASSAETPGVQAGALVAT